MLKGEIKKILGKALVPEVADRLADELERLFVIELAETSIMVINKLHDQEGKG